MPTTINSEYEGAGRKAAAQGGDGRSHEQGEANREMIRRRSDRGAGQGEFDGDGVENEGALTAVGTCAQGNGRMWKVRSNAWVGIRTVRTGGATQQDQMRFEKVAMKMLYSNAMGRIRARRGGVRW